MSGRVVHFEVPFDDAERATKFYSEVFGWHMQHLPEADYTLVSTGPSGDTGPTEAGFINGGMMSRGGRNASHPVVIIDVEDIDKALGQIEAAGGKTVAPKVDVMGMGWSAYFTDSEGNLTGLWQTA